MERTWTVLEMIDWSKEYLASKGFDNSRLEAELLLGHVLSLSRVELYLNFNRQLSGKELKEYKALLLRRLEREPVQYIVGTSAFMFSEFEVSPAVLIPRPETEALVEVAIALTRTIAEGSPDELIIADLGTGSGVIAVTMALKFAEASVLATDTSPDALEVAARNAERAGVASRVTFLEGELTEPLARKGLQGAVSVIVSNPPYIPTGEIDTLPAEVRDFEPRAALDGGPDGLDILRAIASEAPGCLMEKGVVVLEVGHGHAERVAEALRPLLPHVRIYPDYAGRERVVAASAGGSLTESIQA